MSPQDVPELPNAVPILSGWMEEWLYRLNPEKRLESFVTEAMQATQLAVSIDQRRFKAYVTNLLSKPITKGHPLLSPISTQRSVMVDFLEFYQAETPDHMSRGIGFARSVDPPRESLG